MMSRKVSKTAALNKRPDQNEPNTTSKDAGNEFTIGENATLIECSLSSVPSMASKTDRRIKGIKKAITAHPDFPKTGILFRDIFPVFRDVKILQDLVTILVEIIEKKALDANVIAGIEARGFLFGPLIGIRLGVPFVPIRKAGKLPGDILQTSYQLEYGSDTIEVQADGIPKGSKVVIVDDLLATGGTMQAACALIESAGGSVVLCLTAIELLELKGKQTLKAPFESVMQY